MDTIITEVEDTLDKTICTPRPAKEYQMLMHTILGY